MKYPGKMPKDIEAKSHASFSFIQIIVNQLAIVLACRMTARKMKTIDSLEEYYIATESFFDDAMTVMDRDECTKIEVRLKKVENMIYWMRIPEPHRIKLIFPQPEIDFNYRHDAVFIDVKKPSLPIEKTTNYLGSNILSELREIFKDIMANMQEDRQFWMRFGRAVRRKSLREINEEMEGDEDD